MKAETPVSIFHTLTVTVRTGSYGDTCDYLEFHAVEAVTGLNRGVYRVVHARDMTPRASPETITIWSILPPPGMKLLEIRHMVPRVKTLLIFLNQNSIARANGAFRFQWKDL